MTSVAPLAVPATTTSATEYFDVLNEIGAKTGIVKARNHVHRDGDWHRAVHVWLFVQSTGSLLIQNRAACKESWPNLWDISAAGHVTAGDQSLETAQKETHEELGVDVPVEILSRLSKSCSSDTSNTVQVIQASLLQVFDLTDIEAIEPLFSMKAAFHTNNGSFVNNEFIDVYLLTIKDEAPVHDFVLQKEEVAAVRYVKPADLEKAWRSNDDTFVIPDCDSEYMQLFQILDKRSRGERMGLSSVQGKVGSSTVNCVLWQTSESNE